MNRTSLAATATTTAAVCLAGCMDYQLVPIKDPPPPPAPSCLRLQCPVNYCSYTLEVDMGVVDRCYGYDPVTKTWATTPPSVVAPCDPDDVGICQIDMGEGAPDYPHPACVEADASTPIDKNDCHYEDPVPPSGSADLIAQLDGCVGAVQYFYASDCRDDGALQWGDSCACPEESSLRSVGANVTLRVDPKLSYLRLTTPAGSGSIALSGSGLADTATGRLLGGTIAAAGGQLAGSDWSGWTFWFEQRLALSLAGDSFRIPAAQRPTIRGTGVRDGVPMAFRAILGHDAFGHLRLARGTWDVEYSDQKDGSTVVLHLAGGISPAGH